MENPTDDPREFHRQGGPDMGGDEFPLGLETFLCSLILMRYRFLPSDRASVALQGMANRGASESRASTRSPERTNVSWAQLARHNLITLLLQGPRVTRTFEIRSGSGPARSIRLGTPLGPAAIGGENPDQPTMAE
jgi:hypothetical protein